eukprot:CAMPEP_0177650578 /NCGR_PEP_ID=MMETSP0447-20121125/12019_1 /TAXON_ID=0 /ORGANISM="Stygamoeba regulata, Strain BSH-02190019" /LENGTH=116 /DNA_ID=CAMNT_0019153461 /DNA_START=157 /DNA_END=507 /DNA_ORIENTATION=+
MVLPRFVANLLVIGTQVLGRSFAQAWKAAAAKAATDGIVQSTRRSNQMMQLTEARKILNLPNEGPVSKQEILKAYDHLFKANDWEKGGSFYLQSKVVRAKERLDEAVKESEIEVRP